MTKHAANVARNSDGAQHRQLCVVDCACCLGRECWSEDRGDDDGEDDLLTVVEEDLAAAAEGAA